MSISDRFDEISLGDWKIVTNFPEKGWKLSSVKQSVYHFLIS